MSKRKIVFAGHDLKFIEHIIKYFQDVLDYEVKVDIWKGHELHDEEESRKLVEWADIIFCEWGLGNVIWYQNHKRDDQILVVRVHRFEMNTKYPKMFDYSKIDKVIAISPFIYEEFYRVSKIPREKMIMIYNAVDVDRFNKPKVNGYEYNLAIIGICPKLKRLDRALDIFEKLYEKDNRYKLFIKGKHPSEYKWIWNDTIQREYYEKQFNRIKKSKYKNSVIFEGWGDVSEFLTKIGYVLSTSDYESFHMAPIEGMASGAIPIVLKREGVNTIFPSQFIFDSVEDVKIINNNNMDLKEFVKIRYSLEKVCSEIQNLIVSLMEGIQ
ncbi:glycosyltransferase [Caloranaerobacter ferrireducens]|uniref:glycosyltransferase n=1 Tax=Caloranaerobacter ferrireducens TaxID=1323370 RepID=UPI00084CFEA8|nr:glycosyltransferase [Caloranaerobacter ferrireducens]